MAKTRASAGGATELLLRQELLRTPSANRGAVAAVADRLAYAEGGLGRANVQDLCVLPHHVCVAVILTQTRLLHAADISCTETALDVNTHCASKGKMRLPAAYFIVPPLLDKALNYTLLAGSVPTPLRRRGRAGSAFLRLS